LRGGGVSPAVIEGFKSVVIGSDSNSNSNSKDSCSGGTVVDGFEAATCCPICLLDYESGDKVTELPCNHQFHPDCVNHWLQRNSTCPACRSSVLRRISTTNSGASSVEGTEVGNGGGGGRLRNLLARVRRGNGGRAELLDSESESESEGEEGLELTVFRREENGPVNL